jgi:uncharacterized protein
MNMKTLALTLCICVISCTTIFAQVNDAYKKTLRTMLQTGGTEETFQTAITQMFTMFKQQKSNVPAEVWVDIEKEFSKTSLDELVDMLAPVYYKHLSMAEMEDIIKFYKTPAGKKLAEKTPLIMQESMQVGQEWGMRVGQAFQQKLQEKGY